MTSIQMWPFLVSATPTAPYRLLLWPDSAGFLGVNDVMGLASRVDPNGPPTVFYPSIGGERFTCIARYRRLGIDDVGGTPLDARGRPIVVAEGLVAPGLWQLDEASAWAHLSPQVTFTLKRVWAEDGVQMLDAQPVLVAAIPEPSLLNPMAVDPHAALRDEVRAAEEATVEPSRIHREGRVRRGGRFRRTLVFALALAALVALALLAQA